MCMLYVCVRFSRHCTLSISLSRACSLAFARTRSAGRLLGSSCQNGISGQSNPPRRRRSIHTLQRGHGGIGGTSSIHPLESIRQAHYPASSLFPRDLGSSASSSTTPTTKSNKVSGKGRGIEQSIVSDVPGPAGTQERGSSQRACSHSRKLAPILTPSIAFRHALSACSCIRYGLYSARD